MILVIEDDPALAALLSALLRHMRHDHFVAETGEAALDAATRLSIELVMCDLALPDMDGLDLVERMRAWPWMREARVLFCTATADLRTVERARALGAVDFVKKPFALDVLPDRIERALNAAPTRWERWRDAIGTLRLDRRSLQRLLQGARDVLALAVAELEDTGGAFDARAMDARLQQVRGSAMAVGSARTVHVVDAIWNPCPSPEEVGHLRDALRVELGVFERLVRTRGSQLLAGAL